MKTILKLFSLALSIFNSIMHKILKTEKKNKNAKLLVTAMNYSTAMKLGKPTKKQKKSHRTTLTKRAKSMLFLKRY